MADSDMTVGAGATLALAAGDAVELVERQFVPSRVFQERGAAQRTANIAYRTLKLLYFDLPQEYWLHVANHELFGHGGRVRELLEGRVWYHVDAPSPYGRGGGVTFFELDRDVTVHELQAISVAGMEVNALAAETLASRAFARGRLSPRSAVRYLIFELDIFDYIQGTGDGPTPPGHDVGDFLELYNIAAEVTGTEPLTARTLRRESLISLLNPMIASAAFSLARYLATGREDGPIFAIPVGPHHVMPALRYRLTPYGPEWAVTSDIATAAGASARVGVRVGQAPNARPFAVSLSYDGFALRDWNIAVSLAGWKQPPLARGVNPDFGLSLVGEDLEWGGLIRARLESPLARPVPSMSPLTLIVDAALKSNGFAPGEPIKSGLILRAGLGVELGR